MPSSGQLGLAQQREALRRIATWRSGGEAQVACPACDAPGLAIADRSARPHAEWYQIACKACGLDTILCMPLGSMPPTLD